MNMIRVIILVAVLICIASADVSDWRVIGGSMADKGQFPYQVSMRDFGRHHCGGSILNKKWVLTAAHCLMGSGAKVLSVATGSTKLYQGDTYSIKNFILHEAFNPNLMINDIALLQLNGEIKMSTNVQPIPLNKEYIGANATVTLSGWGLTAYPGPSPNDLHFIHLRSITSEDCDEQTGTKIYDSQICTLTKKGEGACTGDSGSPLAYNGKIAGVVSYGRMCAVGSPDVFTRVSSFIDWIEAHIN